MDMKTKIIITAMLLATAYVLLKIMTVRMKPTNMALESTKL